MPLYEYQCEKCGKRFEKIESVSASRIKKCPECGARAERLLAAPAIQFKGSGWYVTDYAGKSAAASKESSGDGAGKTDGKPAEGKSGEGKSAESKPVETRSSSEKESSKKKK